MFFCPICLPLMAELRPDIGLANVAELVDALDLGSSGVTRGSSTLPIRTRITSSADGLSFGLFVTTYSVVQGESRQQMKHSKESDSYRG